MSKQLIRIQLLLPPLMPLMLHHKHNRHKSNNQDSGDCDSDNGDFRDPSTCPITLCGGGNDA